MTDPESEEKGKGPVNCQTGLFIGAEKTASINALFPSSVALPWQPGCTVLPPMVETKWEAEPDITTVSVEEMLEYNYSYNISSKQWHR